MVSQGSTTYRSLAHLPIPTCNPDWPEAVKVSAANTKKQLAAHLSTSCHECRHGRSQQQCEFMKRQADNLWLCLLSLSRVQCVSRIFDMIRMHLHAVHTRNFLSMTKALENKGRPLKRRMNRYSTFLKYIHFGDDIKFSYWHEHTDAIRCPCPSLVSVKMQRRPSSWPTKPWAPPNASSCFLLPACCQNVSSSATWRMVWVWCILPIWCASVRLRRTEAAGSSIATLSG